MDNIELDLDTLLPEPKFIKLSGKRLEVYPPKFKNIIKLIGLVSKFQQGGDMTQAMLEFKDAMLPIIPALKDDDVDLTMEQLNGLVEYVLSLATPADDKALKKAGYELNTEKKTEQPEQ